MQGIGPSMNVFTDFAGISGEKSGIKDLADKGGSNPFQALLQTASGVQNDSSGQVSSTQTVPKDQLAALKQLLEDVQKLAEVDSSEADELKGLLEEMDVGKLLVTLSELLSGKGKGKEQTDEINLEDKDTDFKKPGEIVKEETNLILAEMNQDLDADITPPYSSFDLDNVVVEIEADSSGVAEEVIDVQQAKNSIELDSQQLTNISKSLQEIMLSLQGFTEEQDVKSAGQGTIQVKVKELLQKMNAVQGSIAKETAVDQETEISTNPFIHALVSVDLKKRSSSDDNSVNKVTHETKLIAESKKLWDEINLHITKAIEGQDPGKLAPKVLKLLEQWSALGKQLEKLTGNEEMQSNQASKTNQSSTEGIWKSLTEAFQKRTAMVDKKVYNTVSKVSATDVSKWIANAVEVNSQQVNAAGNSMPMAKLEQFVIHMNPVQTNQQQDENFTTQFARIVETSKFMQNGVNGKPLTITLNPGNLGEITVKMQRVNGELMVRMLVESPESKRLLESNLGQLRHMFSPHQVAVERQEQQVTTTQNAQQNQQSFKENSEKEQQGKQQRFDQPHEEKTDEMSFSEFLMNAKV